MNPETTPTLATDPALLGVLNELISREPIFRLQHSETQDAPFNYLAAHARRLEDRLSSGHYGSGFMMSGAPFFAFEGWDSTVVAPLRISMTLVSRTHRW